MRSVEQTLLLRGDVMFGTWGQKLRVTLEEDVSVWEGCVNAL